MAKLTLGFIRITTSTLNKKYLKQRATLLIDKLNALPTTFPYIQ